MMKVAFLPLNPNHIRVDGEKSEKRYHWRDHPKDDDQQEIINIFFVSVCLSVYVVVVVMLEKTSAAVDAAVARCVVIEINVIIDTSVGRPACR